MTINEHFALSNKIQSYHNPQYEAYPASQSQNKVENMKTSISKIAGTLAANFVVRQAVGVAPHLIRESAHTALFQFKTKDTSLNAQQLVTSGLCTT